MHNLILAILCSVAVSVLLKVAPVSYTHLGFFYLRPKATTLIARSVLSELEMLVGKVLCYLYLSPERLAQQGIFSTQEVYDELLNLADEGKLLKAVNQRSSGSDLDKQKLSEKVRAAIGPVSYTHLFT